MACDVCDSAVHHRSRLQNHAPDLVKGNSPCHAHILEYRDQPHCQSLQYLRLCPYLAPFHVHVRTCDENGAGAATPEMGVGLQMVIWVQPPRTRTQHRWICSWCGRNLARVVIRVTGFSRGMECGL